MCVMMRTQLKSGSVRDGPGKGRFPVPGGGHRNGIPRVVVWVGRIVLLAGLLALTVLFVWAFDSRSMPELCLWHTVSLSHEFTARDETPRSTLKDYLDREEALFRELKEKIYDRVAATDEQAFSRYRAGGPQDPGGLPRNWNRTFELVPEKIRGGALLLHGLTDSPYSLRRIGEILYAKGFYVLGLRLPAHGTIPGALTKVHWEDWMAASRIGAIHVRERIGPDRPFVICGYSNGGALAVKYALDGLTDASLPRPDRLLLFSPEIGIMKIALVANAHKLFSFLPYFAKAKWQSIEPEFDPYKYNSFPMNAAQQAYNLTVALQRQVEQMRRAGHFADFPPVLAFLSWVDATVETSATINRLFDRLENEGSELIIFDVNRSDRLVPFLKDADRGPLERIFARSDLPYRLTLITNVAGNTERVARRTKASRSSAVNSTALGMAWPRGVYSLSHVAIPFAPDDPVYGADENAGVAYGGLPLGRLQARGETHLLIAPISRLMRLRYNPFFEYMAQRVIREIDDISKSPLK